MLTEALIAQWDLMKLSIHLLDEPIKSQLLEFWNWTNVI